MLYIKPPRGDVHLNELYECVTTRLNYFLYHYEQDSTISKDEIKFQYLTLGTALDRTGHFMLRLLSAQSEPLREFVVSSEATFIIERLEFLTSQQILQLITTTLRHLHECDVNNTLWSSEIRYVFAEIKSVFKSSHMIDFKHDENCTAHNFKVSFQMCLSLVAKREFAMEKGKAIIPCGKWKMFLKHLFIAHLKKEIFKIQSSESALEATSDQRLLELKDIVLSQFVKHTIRPRGSNIIASEVDRSKKMFPPCMRYLYNNLKATHRLSHNARFNFSLFLKDIGLPLNESIAFWKSEYSKPSKCAAKCSHCWQISSGKYVYSIRHLYGLEGRRANYCAPSCSKIQSNNLGPVEEGGCPFMNFDFKQLQVLLDLNVVENNKEFEKIIQMSSQGQALSACDCYRRAVVNIAGNKSHNDTTQHRTPVEYFFIMNKYFNPDVR